MEPTSTTSNEGRPTGYICVICREHRLQCRVYETARSLKRHIFSSHQYSKNFKVTCGINGCAVSTPKLRNLTKHLREVHDGAEWTPDYATLHFEAQDQRHNDFNEGFVEDGGQSAYHQENAVEMTDDCHDNLSNVRQDKTTQIVPFAIDQECRSQLEDDDITLFEDEMEKSNQQRRKEICLSLARLRAQNSMTETCFESIKDWTTDLLSNLTNIMIGGMKQKLGKKQFEEVEEVADLGLGLSNPFHGLSEHTFLKVLKADLGYINPETIVLLEEPTNSGIERHTMQYVPIVRVLENLLNDEHFVKQITTGRVNTTGYLKDFCDGEYAINHPLFKDRPDSLQIQLYYDDLEIVNPLGSKTSIHKIGALYYTFMNVEARFRSSNLSRIHLLCLFYVADLKNPAIGWERILERFNQELQLLESGSVDSVRVNGHTITGTLAQLSADNLAAHSLLGYDQKFSGENVHVSRLCLCTGSAIQKTFHENDCILRTKENYKNDLRTALDTGRSSHGVKEPCPLKSKFFHPVENYAADAHHDLLEGVLPQTLKPILQAFIRQKRYFTLQTLNDRLLAFNYNEQDSKNKPTPIRESKLFDESRSLKQNASQYWCLLRKLPLVIGDRIPAGDDHWCLFLCLIGIVDTVLSPMIRRDVLPYLQSEICSFLREYKRLFPNLTITPKMHYLLHYPRLIGKIGPLAHHWVMRYEGKHKLLKKTMDITGNFINSAFTMAKRHQLQQMVNFYDKSTDETLVVITNGKPVGIDVFEHPEMLTEAGVPSVVTVADKVKVQGTVYRSGCVLWVGWDNADLEEFVEVRHILSYKTADGKQEVTFIAENFKTLVFSEHFHAYEVCPYTAPRPRCVTLHDLVDYNVVGRHRLFERGQEHRMFLRPKYRIDPPDEFALTFEY